MKDQIDKIRQFLDELAERASASDVRLDSDFSALELRSVIQEIVDDLL